MSLIGVGLSFIGTKNIKRAINNQTYLVSEVKENYFLVRNIHETLYISEKGHYYEVGDILSISGEIKELDFIALESEFDFKTYLNRKGVYCECVVSHIEVKTSTPFKFNIIKKDFLNHFSNESASLVGAILFSKSSQSELSNLVKELHLVRLISTSGIYLSFFYALISTLLSLLTKKKKIVDLIATICFVPHLLFSFPKFVVIKFVSLKAFKWINDYILKKKFSYLNILATSGILFLFLDYHYAYQDGFTLSYFIPIISLLINSSFTRLKKWKRSLLVIGVISVSLIPFMSNYYAEISPISIIIQIIFTPIFILYYLVGVICFIGIPLYSFIESLTSFLYQILKIVSPIAIKIYVGKMSDLLTFIYESLVYICLYYGSIKLKPVFRTFISIFIGLNAITFLPLKRIITPHVSFINVGQGDATLITYQTTSILIDTGGNKYKDIATEVLIPYFKSKQIYDIDLLITTHDDFDHSGAVASLIENFTVKKYVKDYQNFPISIGGVQIKNYNVYPELWSEENDRSLVLSFKIANYSYLIMGDAPIKIENRIVKDNKSIPCDILKVGHHGSKTSTSENFIKFIKPKYAVISCGKNNSYGHPHNIVIALLKKYHITIKRTDLLGTITF